MLKGMGFMLAMIGATMLDGSGWVTGLIICAAGAAMLLVSFLPKLGGCHG